MTAERHKPGRVPAPDGYEAVTYWRDRSPSSAGSWEVAYRRTGERWWTVACSTIGHADSPDDYVREVATKRVATAIRLNGG